MSENSNFRTVIEKMHDDLFEFKENLDVVMENIKESEAEKETRKLKQENTGLFTQLRTVDPNYNADLGKMPDLVVLEAKNMTEKKKLEKKLDDLKEVMNEGMTKYVDAMEKAHKGMEMVLGSCKKQLKIVEALQKDHENSKEMEKIKNILLQQNNVFIKDLMEKTYTNPSKNTIQKPTTNSPIINNLASLNLTKNNLDIPIQKVPTKEINIAEDNVEKQQDDLKILIFYAEENDDDDDDEEQVRKILKKLTKNKLKNIKANRMGKKGDRPRPIIVTLDKIETLNEIMKARYSLKETEFKGLKIVKFKKDHKKAPTTTKNTKNVLTKKNKAADATNPLLSDESDCEETEEVKENIDEDEELPFKIVLHYVPEKDDEYKRVVEILRVLTDRPLKNVGYRRLGLKPKNHVRPIVVSFEQEEYVEDCIKNRYLLKDNGYPEIKVCHYRDNLESTGS